MEQSDAMLISSLKQYIKVPDEISVLKDVRTQHIFSMACNVFQTLKVDYSDLKQISKAQRFRSMTKLTQTINQQMDTNFDLNDIMSPTLPFVRKLLLAFIGKLGAAQGERNKAIINKNIEGNENGYQKQMLKRWINTQFICPELRVNKKVKYQPHLLKIQLKKDLFKRNLTSQLAGLPQNPNAVLRNAIAKQTMQRKKRQAQQGITRKAQQQNDRNVNRIVKNNAQDWQKSDMIVKKLKKQLLKNQQNQNINQKQKNQMSVYQQQVQKIAQQQKKLKGADDKKFDTETKSKTSQIQSLQQQQNPLIKIRKQCQNQQIQLQNQLKQILNAISQAKQNINQKQLLKKKLQDQIALYEERATSQKQARAGIKKQAQKQKILLDTLQGDTDIVKQVQQLQQQVKYLQKQAQKQVVSLQKQIQNTKKQGQQKVQILKDLKIRLNKIQTDYAKVCQQIQDKTQIKGKVKITKSGISRLYYSKKISQMQVRWRETQKQSKKIVENVNKIRQDIRRTVYLAQRVQTQIQNNTNTSKLRSQTENGIFKQIFQKCKKTFQQTMKCIQQVNQTKNQIQQYQMKVHALAGKDYKENIKKLYTALEELKKQIKESNNKK